MGTQRAKCLNAEPAIGDRPIDTRATKQCVQQVIKDWWPQKEKWGGQDFEQRMKSLQADLIRCHFDSMPDEHKLRAVETLAWLESEL